MYLYRITKSNHLVTESLPTKFFFYLSSLDNTTLKPFKSWQKCIKKVLKYYSVGMNNDTWERMTGS